ncbi:MAG: Na+/H+ antiporter NhaA [Bacteroidetes bacterium]|nr:Na+/H+ antiporter NhaA [Bacteroidota bacterium]
MRLSRQFIEFFNSEKAGGLILIFCTIFSLIAANSFLGADYLGFWSYILAGHSVQHWINDGLMTVFFLLIGLELEREIYTGELSDFRNASLPVIGALGGMLLPAGLYYLLNVNAATQSGVGIPMATDIAFAVGILSLLSSRVPASLKVFLTALAVIDDLGAILIIAIFYTAAMVWSNLLIALGIFSLLLIFNRMKIHMLFPYILGGILMWYFMLNSGIHATITGVLLAFAIPFGDGGEKTASARLQNLLHKPVAFFILPLFALANTGILLGSDWQQSLGESNSLGILIGLIVGKPLGIFLFTFAGAGLGFCFLPPDLKWKHIVGAGFLGGIGFTMSIFISLLAFDQEVLTDSSKIAVLIASAIAGIIGFIWLQTTLPKQHSSL